MSKKFTELTYNELLNLNKEEIKEAYRDNNIDVEWTYRFFQSVKEFRIKREPVEF